MINLIHSEWIKFRSVRSTVFTLIAAAGLSIAVALLSYIFLQTNENLDFTTVISGASISAMLFGALGVQVIGQEFRFNTIRSTFVAEPKRWRVVLAKLAMVTGVCTISALLMTAVSYGIGSLAGDRFVFESDTDWRVMGGLILFTVMFAVFGMGIGAIMRQPIAGIMILLGWSFIAESIIMAIRPALAKWMPVQQGFQMMSRQQQSYEEYKYMSIGGGALYFIAVIAVIWVIGLILTLKRDA